MEEDVERERSCDAVPSGSSSSQLRSCLAGDRDYVEVVLPRQDDSLFDQITRLMQNDAAHGMVLLMDELELPTGMPLESEHGTPSANR